MITKRKVSLERLTCQRAIILDYLKKVSCHPGAEEVYEAVRKKLPRISLGTVYRNLKYLKEKGEIQEIACEACGVSHFDGCMEPHAHFICQRCGKIFDIFDKRLKDWKLPKIKWGEIEKSQITFLGICKKCK